MTTDADESIPTAIGCPSSTSTYNV